MRAALIGHGMVAETHVRAITDSNIVSLAGVLGRDSNRAKAFLRDVAGDGIVYPGLSDLCFDEAVDFAIVTTPPNARMPIIGDLVHAGIPVLMEKPIERTLAAAEDIADLFDRSGVPAGVVFQHRARGSSQALKRAVSDGKLGKLVAAEIRVPWWRDQGYYDAPGRGTYARDGGGVMINQAIHTLDLAIWLMGPVRSVTASLITTELHEMEGEDWAGCILEFEGGAVSTLTATTSFFPGSAESVRLQGTLAHALLEGGVLTISYLDGRTEVIGKASDGTGGGANPMAFTHVWHQRVIEDFAECLKVGRAPLCSVRDGLHAQAVIDAMERSSKTRQTVGLAG